MLTDPDALETVIQGGEVAAGQLPEPVETVAYGHS